MRIIDFSDGFTSSAEPSIVQLAANQYQEFASDAAFVAYKGSAADASDVYYNTTTKLVRYFNGTSWVDVVATDASGDVTLQNVTISGNLSVQGTTVTLNTQTLDVKDINVTVNKGGNDSTAEGAGLTVDRTGTDGSLVYDSTKASKWKAGNVGSEAELVTVSATQTLTNKILTSPTVNTPTVSSPTFSGTVTTPVAASRALVTGTSSELSASATTATELGYVSGVTSAIQTQLNTKAPSASPTFTGTVTVPSNIVSGGATYTLPSSTSTLATTALSETLTNKTLTTPIVDVIVGTDQGITPSPPSAGYRKLYSKSDGKWYSLDSSNVETALGSGGSGGINYLTDADADTSISLWSTYADAAGTSPVDGTGGTPNSTFTRTTASPLRGGGSFLFTKGAANRQGEGFSTSFTIADADKGKVLACSFNYAIASGNFADDDLQWWVYDMINGTLIQPTPYKLKKHNLISDKMFFEFQTNTTSSLYRIICHVASTSTSAYTVKFDDFNLGPQAKLYGSTVTDWVPFNSTCIGANGSQYTNQTTTAFYRWNGDSMQVSIKTLFSGTPGTGTSYFRWTVPSFATIDTTKTNAIYGSGAAILSNYYSGAVIQDSATTLSIIGDAGVGAFWSATSPGTVANTHSIVFMATFPVVGKSSSQVFSSEADTRVVALAAFKSTTQSIANSTDTVVTGYDTPTIDTHGGFNASTGVYTVLVPGKYKVDATIHYTSNATGYRVTQILKDGAAYQIGNIISAVSGDGVGTSASAIIDCVAGTQISQRAYQTSGGALNIRALAAATSLHIQRISGPVQIAASESVNMHASNSSGQSIANGAIATLTGWTRDYDTHNALNTSSGVYTCPMAGKYVVKISALLAYAVYSSGTIPIIYLYKNGSQYVKLAFYAIVTSGSQYCALIGSDDVNCNAGDTLDLRISHGESSARALSADATYTHMAISRIGQ